MTYITNRSAAWQPGDVVGDVDRPLVADTWMAPSVINLVDGVLVPELGQPWRTVRPAEGVLRRFVALGRAGEAQFSTRVLQLSKRYGLLGLCSHWLPADHGAERAPSSFLATDVRFQVAGTCQAPVPEPVAMWAYWARQASALVAVASALREGRIAEPATLDVLAERAPWANAADTAPVDAIEGRSRFPLSTPPLQAQLQDYPDWPALRLRQHREGLSEAIETWLRLCGVALELRWVAGHPEVGFRTGGLLGVLGLQLLTEAVDASGLAVCRGCGRIHAPTRMHHDKAAKRGGGRRTYCARCINNGRPAVLASARWRAKNRDDPEYQRKNRKNAAKHRAPLQAR